MPACAVSKPVISGSVTTNDATAKTSAIQRRARALSSRPIASNTTPARIGSQMARFKKIILVLRRLRSVSDALEIRQELPGQQTEHAQDHHQGIPVKMPRLHQAHDAGDEADHPRRAVDGKAVDQALVPA